jgi:Na+-transporting NADH:ubiquinone oxidoreductase subunit B
MKFLRKQLDRIKPHFHEGGRLSRFRSVFEGFETFMFVPDTVTTKGSHIRDYIDLKRSMFVVIIALLPALLFGCYNVGLQHFRAFGPVVSELDGSIPGLFWFGFLKVLPIIVVSYVVGLGIEFVAAQIRGHEINEGFLVTGMLIPLIVPVDIPLWMLAVAMLLQLSLVGGFWRKGMNILNPALTARAFLFFSYPAWMSGEKVWIEGIMAGGSVVDGFSGATPLALASAHEMASMPSVMEMFIGTIPGSGGETSTVAILIGALILLVTGIGNLKIMISVVLGGLGMGYLMNLWRSILHGDAPWYHLVMGGFAFGALFMATDPVTACQTERGKWVYGFLIGVIAVLIRVLNPAYPEGMMLAILLMNVFAPLIDHYVVEAGIRRRMRRATLLKA